MPLKAIEHHWAMLKRYRKAAGKCPEAIVELLENS
jgi:hypothetical protein